jgi:hypothetical protein
MFHTKFVEIIDTHFKSNIPPSPNNAGYTLYKKDVERSSTQTTKWLMRIACWPTKATDTWALYVIFTAFPLQEWLHERASVLRFMYTACEVLDFVHSDLTVLLHCNKYNLYHWH